MTTPQITTPGTPPDPLAPQPTFRATFYAYLQALVAAFGEANTAFDYVNDTAEAVDVDATAVEAGRQQVVLLEGLASDSADAAATDAEQAGIFAGAAQAAAGIPSLTGQEGKFLGVSPGPVVAWSDPPSTELVSDSTTGASQEIDFSATNIHTSTAASALTTYTFTGASTVDDVTLLIENALPGWDFSAAEDAGEMNTTPLNSLTDCHLSDDGTKLFVMGTSADLIRQYDLAKKGIARTGTQGVQSLSVESYSAPQAFGFGNNGTILYILDSTVRRLYQRTLSAPWDITTGGAETSVLLTALDSNPQDFFFKPDGTKLYILGATGDKVFQMSLSVAWDVTTATSDGIDFSFSSQETSPNSLTIKSDGTKAYVLGTGKKFYQYSLPTPWVLTGATYDSVFLDTNVYGAQTYSAFMDALGSSAYLCDQSSRRVVQVTLGTVSFAFPPELKKPPFDPPGIGQSLAARIITTDGGTTYQMASVQERIA